MDSYIDKKLYGLTGPQLLMYALQTQHEGVACTMCCRLLMDGQRPPEELQEHINTLFRLNDALRTRIVTVDGVPKQYIEDYRPQTFRVLRFETVEELDAFGNEEALRRLDLSGLLCDVSIVLLPDRFGVLFKTHHIIADIWSGTLLSNQLIALLHGETPKAYSITEFFERDERYRAGGRVARDRAFFIEKRRECGTPSFIYTPDPDVTPLIGQKEYTLPAASVQALERYAKAHNTTVFLLMYAALAVCAGRRFDRERFFLGLPILNRSGVRDMHTAGIFVDSAPVLCTYDPDASFSDHCARLKAEVLATMRHAQYGWTGIMTDLFLEFNQTCISYDISLNFYNAALDPRGGAEIKIYQLDDAFDGILISASDLSRTGEMLIVYLYKISAPSDDVIDAFEEELIGVLMDGVENDGKPLRELGR